MAQGKDNEHRLNEARLVKWTRLLAVFTIILAVAGVVADGISVRTVIDSEQEASRQASDTQAALKLAGDQASAAAEQASYAAVQADSAKVAANTAQQEMVSNSRAWVGPTNASIDAAPVVGQQITATVAYQNSGREPAREVYRDVEVEALVPDHSVDDKMMSSGNACFSHDPGLDVAFPSTGLGNGYSTWRVLSGDQVTQDVVDGKKSIYVYGCFVYRTAKLVRHTSFCYFFTNGKDAKVAALNICGLGVRVD